MAEFEGTSEAVAERPQDEPLEAVLVDAVQRRWELPRKTAGIAPLFEPSGVQQPFTWRELLGVVLVVVLCDLTIYRGYGLAGYAALFAAAPWLLVAASPRPRFSVLTITLAAMSMLLAARLVWRGSELAVAAGFCLLVAFAMTLTGRTPYVLDVLTYALQTPVSGIEGLEHYRRTGSQLGKLSWVGWLSLTLPVAAVAVFGTLFVLANPDVATWVSEKFSDLFQWIHDWLARSGLEWLEVPFWFAALVIVVGLLRPRLQRPVLEWLSGRGESVPATPVASAAVAESPLFVPLRNTLFAVVGLFAVYLVFEYLTLWFRQFPKGFYYAGYAHQGAAWLTVALALATIMLSLVFRGRMLAEPRLPTLKRLAWLWSLENFVLAVAVYNRMNIYVAFNGMTRMRTIGLFGITAVVVGFLLVVVKIVRHRDFAWLVRRQLWTLAAAVYLFAVAPVDGLVYEYNVRRILAGDLAPAVQISVHPINAEGILVLRPLLKCEDPIIREGIRAMLAQREIELEDYLYRRRRYGWTTYQMADQMLLADLVKHHAEWGEYSSKALRDAALERFDAYVYQWY
jgi:hypothetical protein